MILKILLYPFSLIYGAIVTVRNYCFDWGILQERTFPIPIISVGNITVGGTGKTPHVEYLIELLLANGFNVAVLSRGYGRLTKGFILAQQGSDANEIGDEPSQLKYKFPQLTLAVDEVRCHGIEQLLVSYDQLDVILLDDAFQHRYVKPGLSILLNDFNRPIYKDMVFPAGRMREPASGKKRAQIIIVSKCPDHLDLPEKDRIISYLKQDDQELFFTQYIYDSPSGLWTNDMINLERLSSPILLLTGIASPMLIEKYLRTQKVCYKTLRFPDHHLFTKSDYEKIQSAFDLLENGIILTTEKDAMRFSCDKNFPKNLKNSVFVLPLKLHFLERDESFNTNILNYVRKHKRNSEVHK